MTIIRPAIFPQGAASVLGIWREFIANSPVNLDYQDNETEFAHLPGKYAGPRGGILLADQDGAIVGCIAFREVDATICEMKRLYVRPAARGRDLGRRLVDHLIAEARRAGYGEIRLDVHEAFVPARTLYADLGFAPAEPVSYNPVPGASFLGLALQPVSQRE